MVWEEELLTYTICVSECALATRKEKQGVSMRRDRGAHVRRRGGGAQSSGVCKRGQEGRKGLLDGDRAWGTMWVQGGKSVRGAVFPEAPGQHPDPAYPRRKRKCWRREKEGGQGRRAAGMGGLGGRGIEHKSRVASGASGLWEGGQGRRAGGQGKRPGRPSCAQEGAGCRCEQEAGGRPCSLPGSPGDSLAGEGGGGWPLGPWAALVPERTARRVLRACSGDRPAWQ